MRTFHLTATSFATRQDLAAFCRAVTNGKSPHEALRTGDNGVGAWGGRTWSPFDHPPICALPKGIAKDGLMVRCKIEGSERTVDLVCRDISPDGIIDLAPSALNAFGLPLDKELDDNAIVWLE